MTLYFWALIILVFRSSIRGLWIEQRVYFFPEGTHSEDPPFIHLAESFREDLRGQDQAYLPFDHCALRVLGWDLYWERFFLSSIICLRILKTQTVSCLDHLSKFEQNSSKKPVGTSTMAGEYCGYISQSARFIFPFTFLQNTMVGSSTMT